MRFGFENSNTLPSAEAARHIDAVCDRFEQQLQDGHSPDLGPSLEQVEEPLHPILLPQLLLLQWDFDERRGKAIDLQKYLARFPAHAPLIQTVAIEHLADLDQRERNFREAASEQQATAVIARRWEDSAYNVLRRLGGGAMGTVWLAREKTSDELVAIKILRCDLQSKPRGFRRFRSEVQALQKLTHPNIVSIHEVDVHLDEPFYTMEYCPGGSLADILPTRRPGPRESAKLIEKLADAVHSAHLAGIVHRDIKPGNILLQKVASDESHDEPEQRDQAELLVSDDSLPLSEQSIPKLADFGLSKDLCSESLSQIEDLVGSPSYMAPEQVENPEAVGQAADIHALGTVLYECLTGQPPFQGSNPLMIIQQVLSGGVTPPKCCEPEVPKALSAICVRCLEKNPTDRYSTAKELADDLQRFLKGEPVKAIAGGWRPINWLQQHRLWLTSLIAACILLSLLATYRTWFEKRNADQGSGNPAFTSVVSNNEVPSRFENRASSLPSDLGESTSTDESQWFLSDQFTFDGQASVTALGKSTILSDQRIVIDTSKEYELSVFASAQSVDGEKLDPTSVHYIGIVSYDIDGYEIRPWNFMRNPTAVDTTLAVDLNPGDITITVTDATGWYDGPDQNRRSFVWYGYENSRGDVYRDYTYTRNTSLFGWDEGGIDGNAIKLNVRWNGPTLRAGEPVRNAGIGYQHNYRFLAPGHVTEEGLELRAQISHINFGGKIDLSKFRPGTHSIAALALADYTDTGTALTLKNFTVSCRKRPAREITGN